MVTQSEDASELSRAKSTQNRRYCISKLFKKATGIDLHTYKKGQAYREGAIAKEEQAKK